MPSVAIVAALATSVAVCIFCHAAASIAAAASLVLANAAAYRLDRRLAERLPAV